MSTNTSNHLVNPAAREAMDKFKMEAAAEVGVNLKNGYNGELTSRQAGSVGGQMVKKMIEAYENGMKPRKESRMLLVSLYGEKSAAVKSAAVQIALTEYN